MQALDNLNRQFGFRTVQYTLAGLQKGWRMRQERRTLGTSPLEALAFAQIDDGVGKAFGGEGLRLIKMRT
jgi:Domain of unknown function (DUF4113)